MKRIMKFGVLPITILTVIALGGIKGLEFAKDLTARGIQIHHCPSVFAYRSGNITANITGQFASSVRDAEYQVNGGDWIPFPGISLRVPDSTFIVEVTTDELRAGDNVIRIAGRRYGIWEESHVCRFEYDPAIIQRFGKVVFDSEDLDVQDGRWEVITVDGQQRVRPSPGHEDYDRILAVTSPFADARRIEAEMTFRERVSDQPFGFGVLPMWGGRPNRDSVVPRSGWVFGLAWYYSELGGVGQSFSVKEGSDDLTRTFNFRNLEPQPNTTYCLIAECEPVHDSSGQHMYYRQRIKWWTKGTAEPDLWMFLNDAPGAPLPVAEFSVALLAHRCQVEFGNVRVLPIPSGRAQGKTATTARSKVSTLVQNGSSVP